MTKIETEFLRESNAIERVYDIDSLEQAKIAWKYLKAQKEMSPSVILKTHKLLMLHQNLLGCDKGYFRTCKVWVGGREGLGYKQIREAIEMWCINANLYPKEWKRHHIRYEHIHPFVDGNGRTGRMFMNWERLKAGLPLLVIHEGEEQQEYYYWFK